MSAEDGHLKMCGSATLDGREVPGCWVEKDEQHWLTFDFEQPGGPISGCHCGFETDFEESHGWGDDVVAHIVAAAQVER